MHFTPVQEDSMDTIEKIIAQCIVKAQKILIITGAGISEESGIPTYRGINGLYHRDNTDEDFYIEDALSLDMYHHKPEITWKYLLQIIRYCLKAKPNKAHHIVSKLQTIKNDTWTLTQNIDGLHRDAGTVNLIEVHGHIFDLYCSKCNTPYVFDSIFPCFPDMAVPLPPLCLNHGCRGIIRPAVVLFNEQLPSLAVEQLNQIVSDTKLDLVISIGTSAVFPYIANPILLPHVTSIEINPGITAISQYVDFHLRLKAGEAMETIWKILQTFT